MKLYEINKMVNIKFCDCMLYEKVTTELNLFSEGISGWKFPPFSEYLYV